MSWITRFSRIKFLAPFFVYIWLAACARYHPYSAADGEKGAIIAAPLEGASGPAGSQGVSDSAAAATPGEGAAAKPGDVHPAIDPAMLGDAARLSVGREFEPVYFDQDSYQLTFSTRRTIHDYSTWLAEHPNVWITLEGHADRSQSVEYSFNLAMARAWAVKDRLAGLGVADERLFTISFGSDRPAIADPAKDKATLNRRVEFLAFIAPKGGAPTPAQNRQAAPPPPETPRGPARSFELP